MGSGMSTVGNCLLRQRRLPSTGPLKYSLARPKPIIALSTESA